MKYKKEVIKKMEILNNKVLDNLFGFAEKHEFIEKLEEAQSKKVMFKTADIVVADLKISVKFNDDNTIVVTNIAKLTYINLDLDYSL